MPSASAVLEELKSLASEKTRATLIRHRAPAERVLGVSAADLKTVEKSIRKELAKGREAERQALAMALYATGFQDAMYLAGMLADGARMTREELDEWAAQAAEMSMIADYTVAWVAVENAAGRELAKRWIDAAGEYPAVSGWCTWSGLATVRADAELDLKEIEGLLERVAREIHSAPNRVRLTMNGFVIAVGCYVAPLAGKAKAAAKKIGAVTVDVGDTACKVPAALESIAKVEARGAAGVKRKTIRC